MNRVTEREGGERWKALYGSAFTKLRVSVGTSRIGSNTVGHSTCALPSSGVGRLVLYSQVIGSHRAQSSLVSGDTADSGRVDTRGFSALSMR